MGYPPPECFVWYHNDVKIQSGLSGQCYADQSGNYSCEVKCNDGQRLISKLLSVTESGISHLSQNLVLDDAVNTEGSSVIRSQ